MRTRPRMPGSARLTRRRLRCARRRMRTPSAARRRQVAVRERACTTMPPGLPSSVAAQFGLTGGRPPPRGRVSCHDGPQ
eukprot:11162718-Lingulodinium_polyedra.AAC.1